jgi:hypothetical protein
MVPSVTFGMIAVAVRRNCSLFMCHTEGESPRSFSDEGIGEFSFAPVGGWGCAESLGE